MLACSRSSHAEREPRRDGPPVPLKMSTLRSATSAQPVSPPAPAAHALRLLACQTPRLACGGRPVPQARSSCRGPQEHIDCVNTLKPGPDDLVFTRFQPNCTSMFAVSSTLHSRERDVENLPQDRGAGRWSASAPSRRTGPLSMRANRRAAKLLRCLHVDGAWGSRGHACFTLGLKHTSCRSLPLGVLRHDKTLQARRQLVTGHAIKAARAQGPTE